MKPREHDFDGAFGACRNCGRYVEECLEHRYCTPRPTRRSPTTPETQDLRHETRPVTNFLQQANYAEIEMRIFAHYLDELGVEYSR